MPAGFQTAIDQALLLAEWGGLLDGVCPVCAASRIPVEAHYPGCVMDQALSERGYNDPHDRSQARALVVSAKAETIPPPPKLPEL